MLLEELNKLNKKLELDNISECSVRGLDNTIINTEIILKELSKRQLNDKEQRRLKKLDSKHQLLLIGFEDWCSCNKSRDTLELIEWAKEVTKKPWDCVKCLDEAKKEEEGWKKHI